MFERCIVDDIEKPSIDLTGFLDLVIIDCLRDVKGGEDGN